MLCEPAVAIDNVGLPKNRAEVLRSASNGRSGGRASIFAFPRENVFTLSEIDNFNFSAGHQKQVRWLDIPVAKSDTLEVRKRCNNTDQHLLKLIGLPEHVHLLPLSEHVLQVESVLDVLADNADAERVVHGLVEEVSEELDDVRMVLGFEQLHGFFLTHVDSSQLLTLYSLSLSSVFASTSLSA